MERESDFFTANGIDADTGSYALPQFHPEQISRYIAGLSLNPGELAVPPAWFKNKGRRSYGLAAGHNPFHLHEAGWGVIFDADCDPAIIEALRPLLDWRKEAAANHGTSVYRAYSGGDGYWPGDTEYTWLSRDPRNAGSGRVNPRKVPYYLLIVGDPERIPFTFQVQLDVQHAVGRIFFESVEEYALYAQSVVRAEREHLQLERKICFFGTENQDDSSTKASLKNMVSPLADSFVEKHTQLRQAWDVQKVFGSQATKENLRQILGGASPPAFLFSATHGLAIDPRDPERQRRLQGSLVCQDWPGPKQWVKKPLLEDFYYSADDIPPDARLWGMIAFLFACYSGGTPRRDEFVEMSLTGAGTIAERSFIARLPQRMLAHPGGGALAVIGHIDRAWGYSYQWESASPQLQVFEDVFHYLLAGYPIGYAFEAFNERYTELAAKLSAVLQDMKYGYTPESQMVSTLWTAVNDAKNFAIFGDPAVRLMVPANV